MANNLLALSGGLTSDVGPALQFRENKLTNELNRDIATQRNDRQATAAGTLEEGRRGALEDADLARQNDVQNRILTSIATGAPTIQKAIDADRAAGDELFGGTIRALGERRADLVRRGLPTDETDDGFRMVSQGQVGELSDRLTDSVRTATQLGLLNQQNEGLTTKQRDFNAATDAANATPEEIRRAAKVGLGIEPRAGMSAQERIANDPDLSAAVAESRQLIKESEKAGADRATRDSGIIERGRMAAQGIPVLRRALTLLDTVETGGLARAQLAASNFFGVTGADEGELSGNLGKAVLGQLRETFGAAFTEGEGRRLEGIEAGFGKSPATNRRLLGNALRLAERASERALTLAEDSGDTATAAEILDFLDFSLDPSELDGGTQGAAPAAEGGVIMEDAQGNRARVFPDGRVEEL